MNQLLLPFSNQQIECTAARYPTPFHVYDERGIRETVREQLRSL